MNQTDSGVLRMNRLNGRGISSVAMPIKIAAFHQP
jgi:hypothetical protein